MVAKMKAAHKLNALNPDGKVNQGRAIVSNMKTSSYIDLTKLPLPLTSIETSIDNLNDAIKLSATGAAGAVSHMHEMERVMLSAFNLLKSYIEMVANSTTDPKSVIESTGLYAVTSGGNTAITELTLTAMGNGIIEVAVPRASGVAAFTYQYSVDKGITWMEFEQSKLATVQLKNQTPASTLLFRFAPIGKTKGAFSQPKSVIVL